MHDTCITLWYVNLITGLNRNHVSYERMTCVYFYAIGTNYDDVLV